MSLPVYPGNTVRAGQVVAQLDTAEVGAKADQAAQEARQAQLGAQVAHLTHHLHHQAALDQAAAQVQVTQQGVSDAQAEAQADQDAIADVQAGVQSAQANADYWKTEIAREKQLADAGAALLARVCLQNGGRLSKRKRERHFAELTEEQVGAAEAAL